jgi:thiol-disulfide isomerase/thioredoxin
MSDTVIKTSCMKFILVPLLLLVSSVSFSQNKTKTNDNPKDFFQARYDEAIGKSFPEFQGICEGKPVNNEIIKRKTVYINFWFEACAPCVAEFDALNDLYHKLAPKKNFEFITFTFETPEKIRELKRKYRLNYKIISISKTDCYRFNQGLGFPTHFILKEDQTISYAISGGHTDKVEARQFVLGELYQNIVKELDSHN